MRLLVVLAVFALAPGARADDVEPPPRDCPAGTRGRSSHSGPHCAVVPCESPCPAGLSCVDHGFCIERVACGHIRDEGDCFIDHVVGECDAAGACARGTCATHRVCLGPSAPPAAPPAPTPAAAAPAAAETSGGCAAQPGRGGSGALAVLALVLVASRRARHAAS